MYLCCMVCGVGLADAGNFIWEYFAHTNYESEAQNTLFCDKSHSRDTTTLS